MEQRKRVWTSRPIAAGLLGIAVVGTLLGMARLAVVRMGRQPDGGFIVSTGQRIEPGTIAFTGRPIDLALHPTGGFFAVLNKPGVFLADAKGVRAGTNLPLGRGVNAGYRGLVWSPDGSRLFASTDKGHVQTFRLADDGRLAAGPAIRLNTGLGASLGNPVPGGMAITRDGTRLFVAAANRNAVVEVDLATDRPVRQFAVENLPFEPRLTDDETTLVVSNWGGRIPRPDDRTAPSVATPVVIDPRGALASGTVSLIERASGTTRHVEVGLHPTAIAIVGRRAYVANAMSDSISEIDLDAARVTRTFTLRHQGQRLLGSMPNALAVRGDVLLVADGGDNALAEIDLPTGRILGFRSAGYFPTAVAVAPDNRSAFVLNTKGNGSVAKTLLGQPGNAHDFQGTVSVVDLTSDLTDETARVARNNRWSTATGRPDLAVYRGAIRHVIYIIKENRTYDEVFGDLPQGNGDPKLCSLGETVMPNHRKLAREFTLFDNAYVSGTNSADGHAWSTQAIANEYLEHFYVGYSRTYPDDGDDPMALSTGGALWDAALARKKSIRVYGEFCDEKLARIEPQPKDWFEVWDDRKAGGQKFRFHSDTAVASLKLHINREYQYWPLFMSDQHRADIFLREYAEFTQKQSMPDLMILSLPCDHGEGTNPKYPTPRAMMADNDLALGRIVEAVSRGPYWKETAIFVIEDDAQSGPDHVDGHRTVVMAISPYTRRGFVDSSFYTTTSLIRSMGLMLGLDPLNRFDALADPLVACFTDTPDPKPYQAVANNVPLDERNPSGKQLTDADRYWLDKTLSLDWSHIDAPDPYWLNRINWYSVFKGARPYPDRPGDRPGLRDPDDDDEDRDGDDDDDERADTR